MNGPFSVGELVIFRATPDVADQSVIPNGDECEIVSGCATHLVIYQDRVTKGITYGYVVAHRGEHYVVEPRFLHRRKPPQVFSGEQSIRELFTPAPVKELEPA